MYRFDDRRIICMLMIVKKNNNKHSQQLVNNSYKFILRSRLEKGHMHNAAGIV